MLEQGLVHAEELKSFINELSCTTYPDIDRFKKEVAELKKNFPTYSEAQECSIVEPRQWLDVKLGRIPHFFYQNAQQHEGVSLSDLYPNTG